MAPVIQVSSADLRQLAGFFYDVASGLDEPISQIASIKVTAGAPFFTEATALVQAIHERAKALGTNLTGLRRVLTAMARKLESIAAKYNSTEELNHVDAKEVTDLLENLDNILP
jgi:hypothetical protein